MSYFIIVTVLMFLAPAACIAFAVLAHHAALDWALALHWFAFWIVGARLGSAGLRQMLKPAYTARDILGLESDESLILVRELGFANTAFGTIGILSLWWPAWAAPVAIAGAVFLGLAGVNHMAQPHRNARENFAMLTDLVGALILAACVWGAA
ncbi:hypothetical protein QTI66_25130 [Variovorax sp. J22R133]|uniref:DUF6790 family protein n=1 Tax=Variovorax brevis TaxID=3053503 RepID=UPI002575F305|nr:DUF6790 family protein [Variovorax sp. J22R133]MDM0115456.1 hypothetical protein [Variovorax sp. J22R133]